MTQENATAVPAVPHLSSSRLDMELKCRAQAFYRYDLGIKIPPAVNMIQGTAFHDAERVNFTQKITSQQDCNLSVVLDAFRDKFQEECRVRDATIANNPDVKPEEDDEVDYNSAELQGLRCVEMFHVEHARTVMPTAAEEDFSIELQGLKKPWNLVGRVDLKGMPIVEWKPVAGVSVIDLKLVGKSLSEDAADRSTQLTIYDAAEFAKTGKHADQLALLATVKTKVPKVQLVQSTRDDADTARMLKVVGNIIQLIDAKLPPTPAPPGAWWCGKKYCGFWSLCEFRPKG